MWFMKLTVKERELIHSVWMWNAKGQPEGGIPNLPKKTLDSAIAKLWHVHSKYRSAISHVEVMMNDIEGLEDPGSVESTELERRELDDSVDHLKKVIDVLEWLRSRQSESDIRQI